MHQQLFTRLTLAANESEVSHPVATEGYGAVDCDYVLFSGSVDIDYQQSDDLKNWTSIGATSTSASSPHTMVGPQAATAAYVRIKVSENAGGTAVLAAGIDLTAQ